MRGLTRIFIALAIVIGTNRDTIASQPDPGELAALIDRHIEARLKAEHVTLAAADRRRRVPSPRLPRLAWSRPDG